MGELSEYSTIVSSSCSIGTYDMHIFVKNIGWKMMTYSISKC